MRSMQARWSLRGSLSDTGKRISCERVAEQAHAREENARDALHQRHPKSLPPPSLKPLTSFSNNRVGAPITSRRHATSSILLFCVEMCVREFP